MKYLIAQSQSHRIQSLTAKSLTFPFQPLNQPVSVFDANAGFRPGLEMKIRANMRGRSIGKLAEIGFPVAA